MSPLFRSDRTTPPEPDCPGFQVDGEALKPCSGKPDQELSAGATPLDETDRVVTLVHGTFARHAEWMRDGGPLCEELLKLRNTRLSRFCWSGANTHTARLKAGKDLAIHLRCLIDEIPHAEHFVAAHSHGGNVALYAMKEVSVPGAADKLGDRVAGVITLATPFLAMRVRALPKIIHSSVLFTIVLGVVMLVYAIVSPGRDWSHMALLAGLFGFWLVPTAVSAQLYRGREFSFMRLLKLSLRKKYRKERDELLNDELTRLRTEGAMLDKLLVVRPLGDEASMGLVVSQFFAYVQKRILNGLQSTQDFLLRGFSRRREGSKNSDENPDSPTVERSRLTGCFFGLLKAGILIGLFGWLWLQDPQPAEVELIEYGFDLATEWISTLLGIDTAVLAALLLFGILMPLIALLAVYIVSSIASLVGLLGLLLAAIPFGVDAMFWNHFASTTAETSPVGENPAHIFVAGGTTASGLAHSGIYVHKEAIRQIVEWISNRSGPTDTGPE